MSGFVTIENDSPKANVFFGVFKSGDERLAMYHAYFVGQYLQTIEI
jgi:hypothetical protein